MTVVYKDKQAEMHFSEEEIRNLQETQKIVFQYENIRHLVNNLSKIVGELHIRFSKDHPKLTELQTQEKTTIDTVK